MPERRQPAVSPSRVTRTEAFVIPAVVDGLVSEVARRDGVDSVRLVGSRAAGVPTVLSDYDYLIEGEADALPRAVELAAAAVRPLASFWDPLHHLLARMVILDGPVKVDLLTHVPNPNEQRVNWLTPDAFDAHFWDWTLWLGSKHLAGRDQFVRDELAKMTRELLARLGSEAEPQSIEQAVEAYEAVRSIETELANQVRHALRQHGVLS